MEDLLGWLLHVLEDLPADFLKELLIGCLIDLVSRFFIVLYQAWKKRRNQPRRSVRKSRRRK